jgi:hypothetical protein
MLSVPILVTLLSLLHCTSAAPPADFPGDETPYRVIPDGTVVSPDNIVGTYLYKYLDCNKNFGGGAKGKIDDAYYDAWLVSKYVCSFRSFMTTHSISIYTGVPFILSTSNLADFF